MFKNIIVGIVCGAMISIIPLVLIYHRHLDLLLPSLNWQQKSFMIVCVVTAIFARIYHQVSGRKERKERSKLMPMLMPILIIAYLFCYTTCAALCQKLAIAIIVLPGSAANMDMSGGLYSGADCPIASWAGLFLVSLAAIMQVGLAMGKNEWIKSHFGPINWSWLVFMAGVPLVFSVWLPLIAIPGAFFVLKWTDDTVHSRSLIKT